MSVSLSARHRFSKDVVGEIRLVAGLGVEGDAHAGATVRHRYMVRRDRTAVNLCQVHLIHGELFGELKGSGIEVAAGEMGENVTTRGIDLLRLGQGTRLHLGESAIVEVTGLRKPCSQMNDFRVGLMKACMGRDETGRVVRKAGIMGIVLVGGVVRAGDEIGVEEVGGWVALGLV